jgi:hypothetical protein
MTIEIIKQLPEYHFDFNEIKKDVLQILDTYNISQIGLTHSTKEMSSDKKLVECTGSIFDYDTKEYKFKETDFTEFNELFKNTSLYEMYKTVPNIGRFRIMTMDGPMCYTIHKDLSKRYHYVIDTNPECLFLFPSVNQIIHVPCDQHLYLLDTRYKHTFVNGSRYRRIHIVMDDLSTLLEPKIPE